MNCKIALVGNPNCGKSTLFNALTGGSQYVGNRPGVTVEKTETALRSASQSILIDLPGVYSLSPYTQDEKVTHNALVFQPPQLILNIVDASNIERNLYLTTQLLELEIPLVIALNKSDLLKKKGIVINTEALSKKLNAAVVEISALNSVGLEQLTETIEKALAEKKLPTPIPFSQEYESFLKKIEAEAFASAAQERKRLYTVKIAEGDEATFQTLQLPQDKIDSLKKLVTAFEEEKNSDGKAISASERYRAVDKIVATCSQKAESAALTRSDKIDKVLTHRLLALPIFALVMFAVYFISVTTLGTFLTDRTTELFDGWIIPKTTETLEALGTAPALIGLLVDGIIGGVGSVLSFIPQMFILFFFLSFLEDCGYMARIAFIMDRIFRPFGLSGKSFIPLLISSGCGVPGIMATKTIRNEKDRLMTIMTATFIPCGAKLPVIALIAGAAMGGLWWVAPTVYFIGIASVVVTGVILKKTKLFAGKPAHFVMELPEYHWPAPKILFKHIWGNCRAFIIKAGTVILLACSLIWFLSSFGIDSDGFGMKEIDKSFLAIAGGWIAPLFSPVGFGQWQAVVATLTGLAAKENIVGTIGVLLHVEELTENVEVMSVQLKNIFPTSAAAFSFLIFNMLCIPCFAAVATIYKQTGSFKRTLAMTTYQTVFAYLISLMIFQFASLASGKPFTVASAFAVLTLTVFLYALFRSPRFESKIFSRVKK